MSRKYKSVVEPTKSQFTFTDAAKVLGGKDQWFIEFTINDLSARYISTSDDLFLTILPVPPIGVMALNITGTSEFTLRIDSGTTIIATFTARNGHYRIEGKVDGHSIFIDGEETSASYSVGSSAVPITFGSNIIVGSIAHLDAIISDIKFGDPSGVLAHFSMDEVPPDENGNYLITEHIQGLDGTAANNRWIDPDIISDDLYINIFERIPVDFSSTPSGLDWSIFRDADGDPIIAAAADWSGYLPDDLIRNENCWYYSKAMTCFSIWSDVDDSFRFPATLLSPRHVLLSAHVGTPIGSEFVFSSLDNARQRVTLLDKQGWVTTGNGDLEIGILDNDIRIDVDYAVFLPKSFYKYTFPRPEEGELDYLRQVEMCGPTREGVFACERMLRNTDGAFIGVTEHGISLPIERDRQYKWSRWSFGTTRTGDSQRPNFIHHGGKLFIVGNSYAVGGSIGNKYKTIITPDVNDVTSISDASALIKQSMDYLDGQQSRTPNYDLIFGEI